MTESAAPLPLSERAERRRSAFLAAAESVFLEQGYDAASVNDIVKIAGGSLSTLYAQFGSKEGLYVAVLSAKVQSLAEELEAAVAKKTSIEDALSIIGLRLLHRLLDPKAAALFIAFVASSRQFPGVFANYLTQTHDRVCNWLAGVLTRAIDRGELAPIDARFAARALLDLLISDFRLRAMADPTALPAVVDIETHVDRVVRLFLQGARPRPE